MSDPWQQMLVAHLRASYTNRNKLEPLRNRIRKRLGNGGYSPASTEIEDEIDDTLLSNYRKTTKKTMSDAIAYVYWKCLREHFKGKPAQLCRGLDISVSTLGRWGKTTLPDPGKIFLALLTQKTNIQDVKFPPKNEVFSSVRLVVTEAMRVTIEQIRVKDLKRQHSCLTYESMVCVEELYKRCDPSFLSDEGPGKDRKDQVYRNVLLRLRHKVSSGSPLDVAFIDKSARQWLLSYAFFEQGRPEWEFLRDK